MTSETAYQEQEALVELLEERASTYALLARLYEREVDQALLDELTDMLYPVSSGNGDLDEGYRLFATALSNMWTDSVTELSVDFGRCFIGQGLDSYSAAYPMESVYTSEKRLIMQDARDEVLAIYRAFGIEKAENWKECEDHVSLELQFERILCVRALEALKNGNEDEAYGLLSASLGFLRDHLCSWTPLMTADLRSFAETMFYQALAYLTDGFLETDRLFLEELLEGDSDE